MENSETENTIDDFISNRDKITILKQFQYSGDCVLGQSTPDGLEAPKVYFVTINLPTKEKFRLNRSTNFQWRLYKPSEQHIILRRYVHLLDRIADQYEMYFEYTANVDLHLHAVIWYHGCAKSLAIDTKRFFGTTKFHHSVDVREAYDLDYLRSYLTEKKEKAYQTSPFPPIIKKTIDDLI